MSKDGHSVPVGGKGCSFASVLKGIRRDRAGRGAWAGLGRVLKAMLRSLLVMA